VFLNGTSAQLGYTVPFTLGVQEKYIYVRAYVIALLSLLYSFDCSYLCLLAFAFTANKRVHFTMRPGVSTAAYSST